MEDKGAGPPDTGSSAGTASAASTWGTGSTSTPRELGPYAVTGRWHSDATGQVLSGRDGSGREVELVLLAPGPGSDPAARDRFAAAAEGLAREHPGRLVELSRGGPLAWAALASGSGPALARPLLESAAAPGAGTAPAAGPDFSPHWAHARAGYPVVPPPAVRPVPTPEPAPWWKRWWWLLAVVALVLVLLLLLSACWPREGGQEPDPTPTPAPTGTPTPSPSGSSPTPSPSGSPSDSPSGPGPSGPSGTPSPSDSAAGLDTPQQPLAQGPGLGGEQFGQDEATTELRLAGLPFPFRVPDGWQCVRSVEEQDSVLYLCMDFDAVAADPTRTAASGLVEVTTCDGVCDQAEWALLRALRSDDSGYELVDDGTALAEDADPYRADFRRVRMSRVYDPAGGQDPTVHVYAEFTAPTDQYDEVRKVVEDIRVNTP